MPAASPARPTRRRRDGVRTREALLQAARSRFARDGYERTTVRQIAADAGANVALINRYFGSKEGLFQACLDSGAEADGEPPRGEGGVAAGDGPTGGAGLDRLVEEMVARAAGEVGGLPEALLLRLRPAADDVAEALRVGTLRRFGEGIARVVEPAPPEVAPEDLALRAQLVLALATGIAVLRTTPGLTPLATADREQLGGPLRDAVDALLRPRSPAGEAEREG